VWLARGLGATWPPTALGPTGRRGYDRARYRIDRRLIAATLFIHGQHHHAKNQPGASVVDCSGGPCANPSEPSLLESMKADGCSGSNC
jgi:hypothetical protein